MNILSLCRLLLIHSSITLFTTFCIFFFRYCSCVSRSFFPRNASCVLPTHSLLKTSLSPFLVSTTTIHLLVTFLFSVILPDFPPCPHLSVVCVQETRFLHGHSAFLRRQIIWPSCSLERFHCQRTVSTWLDGFKGWTARPPIHIWSRMPQCLQRGD